MSDKAVTRAQRRVGTTLKEKYRLDRVLGVGGMAAVYAATHRNGKEFAVKLLHPEISLNDDVRARFVREGYVANAVKHPGAVAIFDDDVADDGSAFLVMELLTGQTVEQLWKESGGRLSPEQTLAVAHQLLDVLSAAHANGIVHRDIKPDNLFVTPSGQLKVLDFGIARLRDPTSAGTLTGVSMGTPAFMAPEQAMGTSSAIDAQTDIWAVGATLFTLLSGQHVHPGENPSQMLVLAATRPARSLSTVMPGAPIPLVELVDRALVMERSARWTSAAEMREATAAVSHSLFARSPSPTVLASSSRSAGPPLQLADVAPTSIPPPSSPSLAMTHPSSPDALRLNRNTASRRRLLLGLTAAAVLVAVVVVALILGQRSEPAVSTPPTSTATASGPSDSVRQGPSPAVAAPVKSAVPAPATASPSPAASAQTPTESPPVSPSTARSKAAAPVSKKNCHLVRYFEDGKTRYKEECVP
jgi:eukaryotic-like serine/threonine-protein kinase